MSKLISGGLLESGTNDTLVHTLLNIYNSSISGVNLVAALRVAQGESPVSLRKKDLIADSMNVFIQAIVNRIVTVTGGGEHDIVLHCTIPEGEYGEREDYQHWVQLQLTLTGKTAEAFRRYNANILSVMEFQSPLFENQFK